MRFAIVALIALAASGLPGLRAQENVYDEINAAWEKRNKNVETAQFEIKCDAFYSKGSISAQAPDVWKTPTPDKDTTASYTAKMMIAGDQYRLEISGTRWDGKKFGPYLEVLLISEKNLKRLSQKADTSGEGYSTGSVSHSELSVETFRPLTRALRSGGARTRSDSIAYELIATGTSVIVADKHCELFKRKSRGASDRTLSICKSLDWSIMKDTSNGPWPGSRIVFDTSFKQHASGIFIPARWEVRTVFKDNSASMTKTYSVISQSINSKLPKDAFDVTFPVGSMIYDDKFSTSIPAEVQPDGEYKPHPLSDPKKLEEYETERQRKKSASRINYALLAIGFFLIATAVCVYYFRRPRERSLFGRPTSAPHPPLEKA